MTDNQPQIKRFNLSKSLEEIATNIGLPKEDHRFSDEVCEFFSSYLSPENNLNLPKSKYYSLLKSIRSEIEQAGLEAKSKMRLSVEITNNIRYLWNEIEGNKQYGSLARRIEKENDYAPEFLNRMKLFRAKHTIQERIKDHAESLRIWELVDTWGSFEDYPNKREIVRVVQKGNLLSIRNAQEITGILKDEELSAEQGIQLLDELKKEYFTDKSNRYTKAVVKVYYDELRKRKK